MSWVYRQPYDYRPRAISIVAFATVAAGGGATSAAGNSSPADSFAATSAALKASAGASSPADSFAGTSAALKASAGDSSPADSFAGTSAALKASAGAASPGDSFTGTSAALKASAGACTPASSFAGTGAALAAAAGTCAGTATINGTGVTSHANFPLAVSSDNRYLKTAGGTPFRIHADSAWDMFVNLNLSELHTYLDDRQSRGINALILQITDPVKYIATSHAPGAKGASDALPFLKNKTGGNWDGDPGFVNFDADFSTPNETYFAWIDTCLSEMATRGMLAIMDYCYMGFNNGAVDGWWQTMTNTANTQTVCNNFGQYLGARYKLYNNIMWKCGTDMFPTGASEGETRFHKILEGIQTAAGTTQLVTAHWKASSMATDESAFSALMTVNAYYAHGDYATPTTAQNAHARARVAYNANLGPAFLVEGGYEDGTDHAEHGFTAKQLRSEWYGAALSSIAGVTMGNGSVWTFSAAALSSNLNTTGAQDFKRMGTFLDSVPWYSLVPNGLGTIGTLITAGGGTVQTAGAVGSNDGNNGTNYVVAAATATGSHLAAYVPDGHSGTVTVDMTKLNASATARWYDPTNGTYTTDSGSPVANTGTHAFTTPGTNAAGDADWVLILTATNIAAGDSSPADSFAGTSAALKPAAGATSPADSFAGTFRAASAAAATSAPVDSFAGTSAALKASAGASSPTTIIDGSTSDSGGSHIWRPQFGVGAQVWRPGGQPGYA